MNPSGGFRNIKSLCYIDDERRERHDFDQLLQQKSVGAYLGIDPTASSMHVGHLVPLMALYWMFLFGHDTTTLVSPSVTFLAVC